MPGARLCNRDLDIDKYELNRTHWALKDVDLFDVLIENGQLPEDKLTADQPDGPLQRHRQDVRTSTEVTPTAFRIPAEPRDPRLVSVMMLFDANLAPVYATIGNCYRRGLHFSTKIQIRDLSPFSGKSLGDCTSVQLTSPFLANV